MAQPAVRITELDGALGALPEGSLRPLAVVGVSSSGPLDTPATFAGSQGLKAIISTYGSGPAVEAAALALNKGVPVVFVRTGQTVEAEFSALTTSLGASTSDVTLAEDATAHDDYEAFLKIVAGGTVGTAGITFQWSLDGGRTLSPVTALGTATSFTFPGSGGIELEFDAGTLAAGSTVAVTSTAPSWNGTEIGTALTALRQTTSPWEIAHIVGPVDATSFDVIETAFAAMLAAGKDRQWVGSVRLPDVGESSSTYAGSVTTAFAAKSTIVGSIAAGASKIVSAVSSRTYRRPFGFAYAPLVASVSEELDVAEAPRFALSGVSIRDANGNPDEYDESISGPSLGERFVVARTWEDFQGVYVNNPRILCPTGSDFEFIQHRRVMNLGRSALRQYMQQRLSRPVYVSRKTGFILEEEAIEIELGATNAMRSRLGIPISGQGGKASDAVFTLSRTDNLLSTKTFTGSGRVVPLAYPKFIDLGISYANPALQIVQV